MCIGPGGSTEVLLVVHHCSPSRYAVTPFGVLVRTDAGVPGRVRSARDDVGAVLRLRVVEFDPDENRFSAVVA